MIVWNTLLSLIFMKKYLYNINMIYFAVVNCKQLKAEISFGPLKTLEDAYYFLKEPLDLFYQFDNKSEAIIYEHIGNMLQIEKKV